MRITSAIITLAYASSVMAVPLGTAPLNTTILPPLVELHREVAQGSDGHLIYFGLLTATTTATATATGPATTGIETDPLRIRGVQERAWCTAGQPVCSTEAAARNDNCDKLVNELGADSRTQVVPKTRQICYKGNAGDNDECCLSVGKVIYGLTKGDVVDPATLMLATCTENGISGKIPNYPLRGDCTGVCLSNHEARCK